ncbi:MAG: class I adenylate-forming enzyme family protein [Panacagrimonas sp.]
MSVRPLPSLLAIHHRFRIESVGEDAAFPQQHDSTFPDALNTAASSLAAAGVRSGDAVLFVGGQSAAAFWTFQASLACGAVFVPVDPTWPAPRIAAYAVRTRARLAVVDALQSTEVEAALLGTLPGLHILRNDALFSITGATEPSVAPVPVPDTAPAAYLPTSGSTGEPKIVVLSRAALQRSAELAVECFRWQAGERLLNLAEPHTMSGLRNAFVAAPLAGMTWLCLPREQRSNVFELLDAIATLRPQRLLAAPILLRQINLLGDRVELEVLASLKAVYCTGADLDREEVRKFHARFGLPVLNYYGLTETVGLCLCQSLDGWSQSDHSIGQAAGCELRLIGADGATAGLGEAGELQVRVPLPMSGYLDDPAATAAMFDGEWLRTGDIARVDDQDRVLLIGRSGTFIKTMNTEKIHPREIEEVLLRHPAIADAAVCGLPERGGGERIAAALVVREGHAQPEAGILTDWVRQQLGPARVPTRLEWVAQIPRGAHGKILRQALPTFFKHD